METQNPTSAEVLYTVNQIATVVTLHRCLFKFHAGTSDIELIIDLMGIPASDVIQAVNDLDKHKT